MARQTFEAAYQKMKEQREKKYQTGLAQRIQLKERVNDCLTNKCDSLKVKANAIAQRLGRDINRDRPPSARDHI